jgi:hypothetical protein
MGLLIRVLRQPTLPGTYSVRLDELLYGAQRLLKGQLLFSELVNGGQPLDQWLYAPSALLGGILGHRLYILAVNLLVGCLLAWTIQNLARLRLIALSPGSFLPMAAAVFFVTGAQSFPEGISGLPEHFSNGFLVLALFSLSRLQPDSLPSAALRRGHLLLAGAGLALAWMASPVWISPTVMVAIVGYVCLPGLRSLAGFLHVLAGGLMATLLVFAPYARLPDGLALAWAGSLQLPLELASRAPGDSDQLLPLLGDFFRVQMAGLPVWLLLLVPSLALIVHAVQLARQPFSQADRLLILPVLSAVFGLETLQAFLLKGLGRGEFQLLLVPLVLIMVCGFAVMEHSARLQQGMGRLVLLILSAILFNNVFLAHVLHAPRQPNALVRALEADRDATRRFLLSRPGEGFTAPQDVALQRQLHQRASTAGIGPEWSLNQRNLLPSWATRKLELPTDSSAVCRQLTDPANQHVVWMRTDPDGPNTDLFFETCLNREPGRWEDISDHLQLSSGHYRLFRRRSDPLPPSSAGHGVEGGSMLSPLPLPSLPNAGPPR